MSKKIYTALSMILILSLPFLTYSLDWSNDYFFPLGILAAAALLGLAAINFKNAFLLIILILPAVFHFNYLKINIFGYLPFFNDRIFYLNPASVIYLLVILFGLITILAKWRELKSLPLKYIIIAASGYAAASIFWSAQPQTSAIELIYLLVPFAIYLIAYFNFSDPASFAKLLLASIISSVMPLIAAVFQLASGSYFYEPDSSLGRLFSALDHPNTFGLFLFLIISLLISFYLAKADGALKNNKLIFFYLACLLFFLMLTYSRTSWVCLTVFMVLLVFLKRKIIIFWLAALPAGALAILIFKNIRLRILEIFDSAIFSSTTARLNIWRVALEQISIKPWFGHGVGLAESIIDSAKPWQGGISLPHNDYLLQALELGLAGLALFLLYTFGAIYHIYKTFTNFENKKTLINLYGHVFILNFKVLAFGLLIALIALLPATIFESLSQKIILQIIIWSLLGGLFSQARAEGHSVSAGHRVSKGNIQRQ